VTNRRTGSLFGAPNPGSRKPHGATDRWPGRGVRRLPQVVGRVYAIYIQ
jgi:hypothetical protein